MVTHELERVAPLLDRVAVLADRRVVAIGPLAAVRRPITLLFRRISSRMTRKGRTMESKAFALWTGLFVIALLAALAAVVIWMSARQGERVEYTLLSRQSVSGLNREAAGSIAASRWARWSNWASTRPTPSKCACAWRWTARCGSAPRRGRGWARKG